MKVKIKIKIHVLISFPPCPSHQLLHSFPPGQLPTPVWCSRLSSPDLRTGEGGRGGDLGLVKWECEACVMSGEGMGRGEIGSLGTCVLYPLPLSPCPNRPPARSGSDKPQSDGFIGQLPPHSSSVLPGSQPDRSNRAVLAETDLDQTRAKPWVARYFSSCPVAVERAGGFESQCGRRCTRMNRMPSSYFLIFFFWSPVGLGNFMLY
jgi:hypothetical protein